MATNPVPPPTPTPPPGSPIPPSPASVLGAADALSASLSYRKLNQADIPKFILDFIIHLQLNVKELKDLNARSAAVRTNAYNKVQNLAKKDSTLALLLLKDKRLTQIAGPIERIKVLQALSDACMIYMDRYLPVVEQVPKTKLISQKIARDLYFHLVKRLPEFYRNIQQATSQTEADEAYSDALLYIQNTAVRPLNRFISTLLGELSAASSRTNTDKKLFLSEEKEDLRRIELEFKTRRSVYEKKWSILRNEALATISNLDVEIGSGSTSSKTRAVLQERRARVDSFVYTLEQGILACKNKNFAGFVTAYIAVSDSLIEYSKRLEFRTLARANKEFDRRQKLLDAQPSFIERLKKLTGFRRQDKKNKRGRDTLTDREYYIRYGKKRPGSVAKAVSTAPSFGKSVYKYLGPAGLLLYAAHSLALNRFTLGAAGLALKGTAAVVKGAGWLGWNVAKYAGIGLGMGAVKAAEAVVTNTPRVINAARVGYGSISSLVGKLKTYYNNRSNQPPSPPTQRSSLISSRIGRLTRVASRRAYRKTKNSIANLLNRAASAYSYIKSTSTPTQQDRVEPDFSLQGPPRNNPPSSNPPSSTPNRRKDGTDPWILDVLDHLLDKKLEDSQENLLTEEDLDLYLGLLKDHIDDKLDEFLYDENFPSKVVENKNTDSVTSISNNTSNSTSNNSTAVSNNDSTSDTFKKNNEELKKKINEAIELQKEIKKKLAAVEDEILEKTRISAVESSARTTGSRQALVDMLNMRKQAYKDRLQSTVKNIYARYKEYVTTKATKESSINRIKDIVEPQTKARAPIRNVLSKLKPSSLYEVITSIKNYASSSSITNNTATNSTTTAVSRTASVAEAAEKRSILSALKKLAAGRGTGLITKLVGMLTSAVSYIPKLVSGLGSLGSFLGKTMLAGVARIAPLLAPLAVPLLGIGAAAYAGWKLGSAAYEKYAVEIADAVDYVMTTVDSVVNKAIEIYEWIVETVKNPAKRFSEIKDKLKDFVTNSQPYKKASEIVDKVKSSPVAKAVGNAVDKTTAAVKESAAGKAVANTVAATKPYVSAAVDKVSTAASGAKTYISDSVGRLFGTNKASVNFEGLNDGTKSSFIAMSEEYRKMGGKKPLNIESARRTTEQQQKLYAQDPKRAARPGYSLHEQGRALDIDRVTAGELESMGLLSKYGFARNVKGEPWHLSHDGNNYASPKEVVSKDAASRSGVSSATPTTAPTAATAQATPKTEVKSSGLAKEAATEKPSASTTATTAQQSSNATPRPTQTASAGPAPSKTTIPTFSYSDSSMFVMNTGLLA